MKKPAMFVFMGGPGSGKGTFAHLLMQQYEFNYVEMGATLRNLPHNDPLYQKIIAGNLAKDEELFPLISKHITNNKDIIIDGFPRTIGQAKWLVENFANTFNIYVLFLDTTEETMIAHIKNRIKEGGNRADDSDEKAVHKRIESFKKITMPAIQWLSSLNNIKFINIVLPSDDIETNFDYIIKNTGIKK